MEIVKNIATILGCCISAITLIGIVVKPVRKGIILWINKTVGHDDTLAVIQKNNELLTVLEEKIDNINKKSDNMDSVMLEKIGALEDKVDKLDERVFENERDRIRAELSSCASRCRRKIPLHEEEFRNIQESYRKYDEVLHCNGIGHDTWVYINDYYNSQDFEQL